MSSNAGKVFVEIYSFFFAKSMTKYRILLGAMSLGLCMSTPWFYGNLLTYEYSYFKYRFGEESGVYTEVSWIYPGYFTMLIFGLLSVDSVQRMTSLRVTLLTSLTLEASGMFLSYFTVKHSVWATMLSFSLIFAAGQGMKLALGYLYASRWLGKNVGLSTGLVMSSNGLGGIVFNVVITTFMNPENLKPATSDGNLSFFTDRGINERFPKLYLIIGSMAAVFQLIALVFIEGLSDTSAPDEEKLILNEAKRQGGCSTSPTRCDTNYISMTEGGDSGKHRNIIERESEECMSRGNEDASNERKELHQKETKRTHSASSVNEASPEFRNPDTAPSQVLKSIQFYTIWLSMFAMGLSFLSITNSYKLLSQLAIRDDDFLVLIGSGNCIAVIFCRLIIGYVVDRFGVFNTIIALLSTNCVCLSFWFVAIQPSRWLFLIWTSLLIGLQSTTFNVFPVAVLKSFGSAYYVTNTALLMSSMVVCSLVLPPLMSHFETAVGWVWFFQFVSGIAVVALLCFIVQQLFQSAIPS